MADEPLDKTLVRGSSPDPHSPLHAPVKSAQDARAGVMLGRMRWVLAISFAAAAAALVGVYLYAFHV